MSGAVSLANVSAGILIGSVPLATQKALLYTWGFGVLLWFDLSTLLRRKTRVPFLGHPLWFVVGSVLPALGFLGALVATGALGQFVEQNITLAMKWQATERSFSPFEFLVPVFLEGPIWFLVLVFAGVLSATRPDLRHKLRSREGGIYLAIAGPAVLFLWVNPIPWPYNFIPTFAALASLTAVAFAQGQGPRPAKAIRGAHFVLLLIATALYGRGFYNQAARSNVVQRERLQLVLDVSTPDLPIFDTNGGYLFRPAAYWYWYHSAAMRSMMRQQFAREMVTSILDSGATVWLMDYQRLPELPPNVKQFLFGNYQRYQGSVFLWGKSYRISAGGRDTSRIEFTTLRAGCYFVTGSIADKNPSIQVDDMPVSQDEPFELSKGAHVLEVKLESPGNESELFILWLPANGSLWKPLRGDPPGYYDALF